jgi:cytosine/adenosine deaminase-related metal-dependent hydrolase
LNEAAAVSRAARDVGIRVAFAWPFFDRNPIVYGDLGPLLDHLPQAMHASISAEHQRSMRSCADNMALIEQAAALEHALFQLQYHPVAPQWVQEGTLSAIAAASATDGRRIHTHLFETHRQRLWADQAYPQGLLRFLDSIGFLSPRLTVAHAVWLRDDEMILLRERGVTVSLNVSSNLRLQSGLPPIDRLDRAGVALAYGLDGMALDDDQDMLRELRLARLVASDGRVRGEERVLQGSWQSARRSVLGEDGGGRIVAGAPADLMLVDFASLSSDNILDAPDPVSLLLGRGQSSDVRQLFVAGRQVVADGRCQTVDLQALRLELVNQARTVYASTLRSDGELDFIGRAIEEYYRPGDRP